MSDSAGNEKVAQTPLERDAYRMSYADVARGLSVSMDTGLSTSEAEARLRTYGKNELDEEDAVSLGAIIIGQTLNSMVMVLVIAMIVSFSVVDYISGAVLAAVVIINIIVGTFQEYQAARTMDSLKSLGTPSAHTIRDGQDKTVPSGDVVPGDIVVFKTGDTIPADIRVFECMNLETDEALLTGEALPIAKDPEQVFENDSEDVPVGDRINLVFSSSTVTKGRGKGIVVATGMQTELGAIAAQMHKKDKKLRKPKKRQDGSTPWYGWPVAFGLSIGDMVGKFLGVNVGTPLQRKLSQLAVALFLLAIVFAVIVEAANNFSADAEVVVYAVATGVAMIPGSLVVVLTITMALGVKAMVKRNVIVRNLDSLEALGGVTDICSDKTGTLTQGKMVVKKAWLPAVGTFAVGSAKDPIDPTVAKVTMLEESPAHANTGKDNKDEPVDPDAAADPSAEDVRSKKDRHPSLDSFLDVAAMCNLATIKKVPEGSYKATGDPTEIAIQVFAERFHHGRHRLTHVASGDDDETEKSGPAPWKEIAEYPFDSDVKRMSVVYRHEDSGESFVFSKGAVERVLSCCDNMASGADATENITEDVEARILKNMEALASQGLRVLALARRAVNSAEEDFSSGDVPRDQVECNLTLLGLVGIYDPPRPESAPAVAECHKAGIGVHMLTGDHPGTARAIAIQVGILPRTMGALPADIASAMVMTGSSFDRLSEDEIDALPVLPLVIARCAPSTKVRMIEALHRRKAFAAMTGDGVNDSPSLKRADVGIAMGQNGSDVAKDASDIVLADDNFASILNAVEEGRRTFDNIKKFILHLLAGNWGQALVLLVGLVFMDESGRSVFPLSPVEVLWIIMITASFPAMGLGQEQAASDVMDRPPHDTKVGVFTWEVVTDLFVYGIGVGGVCLAAFITIVYGYFDGDLGIGCNESYDARCEGVYRARSLTFITMTWSLLLLAFEMIDMRRSMFALRPRRKEVSRIRQIWQDLTKNRFLFWSSIIGGLTTVPIVLIPGLNRTVFKHGIVGWEWALALGFSLLYVGFMEAWKWAKRIYFRRSASHAHNPMDDLEATGGSTHFAKYISMSRSDYGTQYSTGGATAVGKRSRRTSMATRTTRKPSD
ncbi:P-type ATPase [Savitreella phatthalungensis]